VGAYVQNSNPVGRCALVRSWTLIKHAAINDHASGWANWREETGGLHEAQRRGDRRS
jgi:hypothetical protein